MYNFNEDIKEALTVFLREEWDTRKLNDIGDLDDTYKLILRLIKSCDAIKEMIRAGYDNEHITDTLGNHPNLELLLEEYRSVNNS